MYRIRSKEKTVADHTKNRSLLTKPLTIQEPPLTEIKPSNKIRRLIPDRAWLSASCAGSPPGVTAHHPTVATSEAEHHSHFERVSSVEKQCSL